MNALQWIKTDLGLAVLTRATLWNHPYRPAHRVVRQALDMTIDNLIVERAEQQPRLCLFRAVRDMAQWQLGVLVLVQENVEANYMRSRASS